MTLILTPSYAPLKAARHICAVTNKRPLLGGTRRTLTRLCDAATCEADDACFSICDPYVKEAPNTCRGCKTAVVELPSHEDPTCLL